MILHHFTSLPNLRPISKHGLTIGDVPTDLRRNRGRLGVWFTSSSAGTGHGISGGLNCKTRYRLTVDVPQDRKLVQWSDWAPGNITAKTFQNLIECAGKDGQSQWSTWFFYFGVLLAEAIVSYHDMATGHEIADWADVWPVELDEPWVPGPRRHAWLIQLLKGCTQYMRAVEHRGVTLAV